MPSASASAVQCHHKRPRRRGLPSQSQSPAGMSNIRTRRPSEGYKRRKRQARLRSRQRRHRCHRRQRQLCSAATASKASWLPSQSQSPLGCLYNRIVDLSWVIAYAASVERAYAVVNVITDAIRISVSCAVTTIRPRRQAGCRHSRSRLLEYQYIRTVDFTWAGAYAASVKRAYTVINIITDTISVSVSGAVTPTNPQCVRRLPSQSQSPSGRSEHPHS